MQVGELASSISETHTLGKEKLVFLNTSDILHGKFLHRTYSAVKGWPGQAKKSIRKGDILFSEIRPANGRWAYVDEDADDFVVSTKLMVIRANQTHIFPKFLYQYLTSSEVTTWLQHLAESRSGTFPQITFDQVATLELPLPPLTKQVAIASVIGMLDDKIELNRRMNATLEAMTRALFQSWFVDFDPVKAKRDGRVPHGMDAEMAQAWPDSFQESALGAIPVGWRASRLDEIAGVQMGLSPKGDTYNSSGVGKPLINGPVEFGEYFPAKTKWTEAGTRFSSEHDLIFCVRGSTTGRRVVADAEYALGRGVCAIRARSNFHSFLYKSIEYNLQRLLEKTTGSVFPSLSAPDIKGFAVLTPDLRIVEHFEKVSRPLVARIQQNYRESTTLSELRDTLLPKLLSGELRVPASVAHIEATL